MGRQAAQRIRRLTAAACALAAAGLSACGAPPGGTPPDAPEPIDAAGDAPAADAQGVDAAGDAAPGDAGADAAAPDAAADAGPDPDPGDIVLQEVDLGDLPGGMLPADGYGLGSGAALGDVDGDGDLDVVLARCDTTDGGPSLLLRNQGFPAMSSDAAFAAAQAGRCAHGAALGDLDRDGDLDLFLAMSGTDRLLVNDGSGGFTDATTAAGVAGPASDHTTGGVWADVDRDGLLDLYVLQHVTVAPPAADPLTANRLYRNLGDGTFREVAAAASAAGHGSSQAGLIADLDGDGELEIYVANDRFGIDGLGGVAELQPDAWLDPTGFDGEGVPSYTDRAAAYGVDGMRSSMGVALADLDRDGHDDLYVADWGTNHLQMWNPIAQRYDLRDADWDLSRVFNPAGHYNVSWGVRFVDLDRDGGEEVIIVNGSVTPPVSCSGWSQLDLYLRRAPGTDLFVDMTAQVPWPSAYLCPPAAGVPLAGRAVVTGDLDGDGDDDVIVTPFRERFRFWRNQTAQVDRHRVRVRPRGQVAAPDPVGAVLEVDAEGVTHRRVLAGGGDPYSQSARVLEVGLGAATAVTAVRLRWPSGYVQRLDLDAGFALDTELAVVEPAWLALSARLAAAVDPAPVLTYRPVDPAGQPVGAAAATLTVIGARSDGQPVTFTWNGSDAWTAPLPHPGAARVTVIAVTVDGVPLGPRLTVRYR